MSHVWFKNKTQNCGFTAMELLVTLAIGILIVGVSVLVFQRVHNNQALTKDENSVVALIREARTKTISGAAKSQYGIHLASDAVTLFKGSTYSAGASDNLVLPLHFSVILGGINLAGGGNDVVFDRLTGNTNQAGTFTLTNDNDEVSTITISSTGSVSAN